MGKSKNRNKRRNQNQDSTDEENNNLYSDLKTIFVSSNGDVCRGHEQQLNANIEGCCESQEDSSLATPITAETGTKPKMNFKNFSKNSSDRSIGSQYKRCISSSNEKYDDEWYQFYKKYLLWRNNRLNTISKLKDLMKKVHDDQLTYNKTNIMFKELNVTSRMLKDSNNSTVDFFASLGTFLTDAASGITSMAQAVNVDTYNAEFKKIMEEDAEITKPFYISRSQYVEQYRDVEEVVPCFHSETFENTLGNLSETLKLNDLWLDLKNAHEDNPVSATMDCLDRFISKTANTNTVSKICDSFGGYIGDNPAALDACKSAGKAVYGIYDTWGRDRKQKRGIIAETNRMANNMIICEEKNELCQLRSTVSNSELTQAKLESKIEDAIDSLQSELNEMSNLFNAY